MYFINNQNSKIIEEHVAVTSLDWELLTDYKQRGMAVSLLTGFKTCLCSTKQSLAERH